MRLMGTDTLMAMRTGIRSAGRATATDPTPSSLSSELVAYPSRRALSTVSSNSVRVRTELGVSPGSSSSG